jgi:hypothetical protein
VEVGLKLASSLCSISRVPKNSKSSHSSMATRETVPARFLSATNRRLRSRFSPCGIRCIGFTRLTAIDARSA